jgi:hypothetical protein
MEDLPNLQTPIEGEPCYRHPERNAIEKCEVCGDALCGYCLYYTGDGQRLCEKHAQIARANGIKVVPPAMYADGIIPSQAEATRGAEAEHPRGALEKNRVLYQGNNQDLQAFVGMIVGFVTMVACCSGTCCLPVMPIALLGLGVLSLSNARDAVDPRRTRQQSWITIGIGSIFSLGALAIVAFYVLIIVGSFSSIQTTTNLNTIFATPTVTVAPTTTDTPTPNIEPSQLTATARAIEQTDTP